jgi:hypothetical protein
MYSSLSGNRHFNTTDATAVLLNWLDTVISYTSTSSNIMSFYKNISAIYISSVIEPYKNVSLPHHGSCKFGELATFTSTTL